MGTSKKYLYIFCTCIVFGLFLALLLVPFSASGLILGRGQVISQEGEIDDIRFPYLLSFESDNDVTFQFHFAYTDGDTLVLCRPSANAMEVSLNGQLIYRLGDMEAPTSNIWNSIIAIPLLNDLQDENTLEIKLASSSYNVGLSVPPFIEDFQTANTRAGISRFLCNDILYLSIGAALIAGLILIMLSLSRESRNRSALFLGFASFMAAIYCLDFTFRLTSGSLMMFFWLKKVMMISGYLATLFFLIGIEIYSTHKLKISKIMFFLTAPCIILIGIAWNMVVMNNLLRYLNIVLLFNFVGTVFILFRHQDNKPWMIIPAVLLTLSLIQLVVLTALELSLPFVLQYNVLVSAVVFGVSMINEYNQLFQENYQLEQKANRDPLTGVYNRNILEKIPLHPNDILVIIDIDNLKQYNDKFGHPEGDKLLITLTETIRVNLRQTDLVVRYGGDEFILILRDTTIEITQKIIQRIKDQFAGKESAEWASFSYGIEKVDETFNITLQHADEILYCMKKEKKEDKSQMVNGITG